MDVNQNYLRYAAKELFDTLNTNKEKESKNVLDSEEIGMAVRLGSPITFSKTEEPVTEQKFIDMYIETAQKDNCKEAFEERCKRIKNIYTDLKNYKNAQFGIVDNTEYKEIEVSMDTMRTTPSEGMFTMYEGYKILYKNNSFLYKEQQFSSLYAILEKVGSEIKNDKCEEFNKNLSEAKSKEEKEKVIKDFVNDLPNWNSNFESSFYKVNGDYGPQKRKIFGINVYFNVDENYQITFDFDKIYKQVE